MKNLLIIPVLAFFAITGIAESSKKKNGERSNLFQAEESAETFEYGELDEDRKQIRQRMEEKENLKNINHKERVRLERTLKEKNKK